ncbi:MULTISPECIES: aminopeptidase [Mycobacteriaceae]|uniref:aminopeptidase n=1 Tax=Mycobacteriaceae TaxID=1762 RepID=UPI0007FD403E|nr:MULTISPECIES: aminopeptidase [Mycobacteriaceae]MCK0174147.1 aminopeptidase [Mycolicibacterium sp. F2034L]OBB62020.1 aminopeptidase [Mycobacterium sp. 852013-51886_SCH5428379]
MTARRLAMVVGAIILLVGVIGLLVPVSASDGERSVSCGNALVADKSAAQAANNDGVANVPILNELVPHTDFVALCDSAVSSRRTWTIPVAVIGALVLVGSAFLGGRSVGARRP